MKKLRLIYMGTPDFSVPPLQALIDAGHDVCCVYTQAPKPKGRGHAVQKTPVHAFAEKQGIQVLTPRTLRKPDAQAEFLSFEADAAVVAAYGLILPPVVLEAPKYGCLNIHASLLPRWRGASPIQRAVMAGDAQTGITIMQMDEGLDTGPMLKLEALPITSSTTAGSLHDDLSQLGAKMIVQVLEGLADGDLFPIPQPAAGVTHAPKLDKEDGRIDFAKSARELDYQIRGLTPWPGSWFEAKIHGKDMRIKVLQAKRILHPEQVPPGTLVDEQLTISCGDEALRLTKVQRPGKPAMNGDDFLRGTDWVVGDYVDRD